MARETEAAGTDAKAEALLELIYGLQQEESDPTVKVLVFTEFVPTQRMLADYLEGRGFTVALLNGSMNLDARTQAQLAFSQDAQILISTDAGGEGLNLQFCHVVVNFDMPWNPMRIEQRIGRVDRIGQQHVVRATNFVLEETVEYRVRQVLEEKLAVIAKEFGVDKAADVMDSVEAEPWFDELFVKGITDPESVDQQCDAVVTQIREKIAESRQGSDLIAEETSEGQRFSAEEARQWRDHPAQFWLERTITTGLPVRGGEAVQDGDHWRIRWLDGSESARACFDARTAEARPELEWITLEDARARALIAELPRCVAGQPIPRVRISGLPETVAGVWSLWEISLSADTFTGRSPLAGDELGQGPQPSPASGLLRRTPSAASASCPFSSTMTGGPSCPPPGASGISCSPSAWSCWRPWPQRTRCIGTSRSRRRPSRASSTSRS